MTFFSWATLFGGIGLFLYGMTIMGSGLEKLASGKTEKILQSLTSSILKGALLGLVITAIIQSSSGTTVIVIGLVNAGIMKYSQALGVIMGANIGTTVTGQIIRLSDISGDNFFLQLMKPSTLAPLAALVGALLYIFFKDPKKHNIGQILLGFGILFTGMMAMEGAVLPLRDSPGFIRMFTTLTNPVLGVLAGAGVTGIIQSSSASVGILQALTATGLVTWSSAVPIILGQNIGTCVTGLIASVSAARGAKRVAFSHLYFNIIGAAIFLIFIYGFKAIVGIPFWNDTMNMGDIANFHTIFNVVSTAILLPCNRVLVKLSEWTMPEKKEDIHPELLPTVLDTRLFASPSVAISQAHLAVEQMADLGKILCRNALLILMKHDSEMIQLMQQREELVDKLEVSVTNYLVGVTRLELSEQESREVTTLLTFVGEFERIGDYAINLVEWSGDVFEKHIQFSEAGMRELDVLNQAVQECLAMTFDAFVSGDPEQAAQIEPLEQTIDELCEIMRANHIDRLKSGQCGIEAGIIFLDILTNFERISDHCSNVAARLISDAGRISDTHRMLRELHEGKESGYNDLMRQYHDKYTLFVSKQG